MTVYDVSKNKKNCFGCGVCADVCPTGAITMDTEPDGFRYPKINQELCMGCGKCKAVCPSGAKIERASGKAYAVRHPDGDILKKSASGGAFSLLADAIIRNGGLVCGAVLDDTLTVRHVLSDDISGMRKSKYIQSDMTSVYADVRSALGHGRTVLFTGTPCQCHALIRFLDCRPDNLYLTSLICRGVQSPELWSEYKTWLGNGDSITAYDFRDKRGQDNGHMVSWTAGNTDVCVSIQDDVLSSLYARCMDLRPSCYICPYCSPDNEFDFIIGDFWGIEKVRPDLYDGKGVSVVVTHGRKSERLLRDAVHNMGDMVLQECSIEDIRQPALESPADEPFLRKFFVKDYERLAGKSERMAYLVKKYTKA